MTTLVSPLILFIKTLANNLRLSVSSVKFYQDVISYYQGYGIKYIFTLSVISSLMCNIVLLVYVDKIEKYLSNDVMSESVANIDYIIRQLPTINYNGKDITVSEDSPAFIYDVDNVKLLAIDLAGKLSHNEKMEVPFVLMKEQLTINLRDSSGKIRNTLPIKYAQIFGSETEILTKENIKASFASWFTKAPKILIYIVFPLISLMIFISTLLEKSFMILVIFIISYVSKRNLTLKDCIRVVLFSSGVYTVFQFVFSLALSDLSYVLWIIQTWANILMIIGITKSPDRRIFFSQ